MRPTIILLDRAILRMFPMNKVRYVTLVGVWLQGQPIRFKMEVGVIRTWGCLRIIDTNFDDRLSHAVS